MSRRRTRVLPVPAEGRRTRLLGSITPPTRRDRDAGGGVVERAYRSGRSGGAHVASTNAIPIRGSPEHREEDHGRGTERRSGRGGRRRDRGSRRGGPAPRGRSREGGDGGRIGGRGRGARCRSRDRGGGGRGARGRCRWSTPRRRSCSPKRPRTKARAKGSEPVRRRGIPWPVRSVIAGAAGTAAMTLAYATEHRLRPTFRGALDYDDSLIPGKIVAKRPAPRRRDRQGGRRAEAALKWGYGSAFGLWHGTLRRFLPEPWASAVVRRDAHECDLHVVPRTRPNASTVAMGPGRLGDQRGDARRLRRRRGVRGRSVPLRQRELRTSEGPSRPRLATISRTPAQRHLTWVSGACGTRGHPFPMGNPRPAPPVRSRPTHRSAEPGSRR